MIDRRLFLSISAGCALTTLSGAAEPAPKRLLLVHGRAQQGNDPKALKESWLKALKAGLKKSGLKLPDKLQVDFPFYGDLLEEFVRQSQLPLTSEIQARGENAKDDGFLAFQAEVAEEMRVKAGVTDSEINAEYGANPRARGPQNWEWVQAILRALDKKRGFTQAALEKWMRDVYLYISRRAVREAIDAEVSKMLTGEPTVVVGHSLGSVVAYSVLLAADSAKKFPLYATVGSPLAIRPIRKAFEPLKYPVGLGSWYNAFDQRDVVALYALDATYFNVLPAVENKADVDNHTRNRHGIDGYLDDKQVARKIFQAL